MTSKRTFGTVRRLPSGRWQARYRDASGRMLSAPRTFATKAEAGRYLATVDTDTLRGVWVDPRAGMVPLGLYAKGWIDSRPRPLRARTRELYEGLLRNHICPVLGPVDLAVIKPSTVRRWHSGLLSAGGPGPSTVAKCYRLLHAILATAVQDELIIKNPCVLKDAGVEHSPERPVATIQEVCALADAVEPRYRALVLLATFGGLRLGELLGLQRCHVDLLHGDVQVVQQMQELASGRRVLGPPNGEAGRRTVNIPAVIRPDIEAHLNRWSASGRDGLVFCRDGGGPIIRGSFNRKWRAATQSVGVPHFHFHDLRHTGNTLAAATGASTKELMVRMGHSSSRAALIYQHATGDRDKAIAVALSRIVEGQLLELAPAVRVTVAE